MVKALKAVFGLVAVVFLVWWVGGAALLDAILHVDLLSIVALLGLAVALIWVSCIKWQLFLRAQGHRVGVLRLMDAYTVGYFVNLFVPSFVAGDAVRSVRVGAHVGSQADAFVSTFMERFTGLLAMVGLGVLFVCLGAKASQGAELSVLLLGLATGTVAISCFSERFARWLIALGSWAASLLRLHKIAKRLDPDVLAPRFVLFKRRPSLFFLGMMYSLLYHCVAVVNTYVAAQAVGWDHPDFMGLFVVVPLVLIVGLLPLTPSGIGIQEGAFVFFLTRLGASPAEALATGVLLRAKVVLIALFGGVLWVAGPASTARETPVSSEEEAAVHVV